MQINNLILENSSANGRESVNLEITRRKTLPTASNGHCLLHIDWLSMIEWKNGIDRWCQRESRKVQEEAGRMPGKLEKSEKSSESEKPKVVGRVERGERGRATSACSGDDRRASLTQGAMAARTLRPTEHNTTQRCIPQQQEMPSANNYNCNYNCSCNRNNSPSLHVQMLLQRQQILATSAAIKSTALNSTTLFYHTLPLQSLASKVQFQKQQQPQSPTVGSFLNHVAALVVVNDVVAAVVGHCSPKGAEGPEPCRPAKVTVLNWWCVPIIFPLLLLHKATDLLLLLLLLFSLLLLLLLFSLLLGFTF